MALAIVGGVHGKIDIMLEKVFSCAKSENRNMENIEAILQTGDFGVFLEEEKLDKASRKHGGLGDFKDYYEGRKKFSVPTYFIKGNHEDFDLLEQFEAYWPRQILQNLFYISNGRTFELHNLKIAALGGNFSQHFYNLDKSHPLFAGARRRHFNHQDIEFLEDKKIDIILAHNSYKDEITEYHNFHDIELLLMATKPKYYFSSHFHHSSEEIFENTKIINLDKVDSEGKSVYFLDF